MLARVSGIFERRPLLAPGAALLLLLVHLLPARATTMRGDDAGFTYRGVMQITGESLPDLVGKSMMAGLERFRPQLLASIQGTGGVVAFEGNTTAYKLYLVLLTVLCGALLWALLRRLGAPVAMAAIGLGIFAASIQFHAYHDPVLGYYGSTQTSLALVLGSLIAFLNALRTGRRRPLVVAVALFTGACLLHEYVYPVAAAHLALALHDRRGLAALRSAAPLLGVGLLFILIGLIGRLGVAPEEAVGGYEVSTSPLGALRTFLIQLLPPLPASARIFDQGPGIYYPSGSNPTRPELLAALWRGLAVAAAVAGGLYALARRLPAVPLLTRMAGLGVALWTTPVMLIALAPKYQADLAPGKPYLPVLFQSVGVALALAAALGGLLRLAARRSRMAVLVTGACAALLLGLAGAATGFNNTRVAALDNLYRVGRDLIEEGASRGAFGGLERGTTVLFSERDTTWSVGDWRLDRHTIEAVLIRETGVLFDGRVNVEQTAFDCPDRRDRPVPADCEPFNTTAAWARARPRPGGGSVFVARLDGATTENFRTLTTTTVRAYNTADAPPALIGTTADGQPWTAPADGWTRLGGGDGWSLHELRVTGPAPVAATLDDAIAKVDYIALPGPDERVRIYGTARLLP